MITINMKLPGMAKKMLPGMARNMPFNAPSGVMLFNGSFGFMCPQTSFGVAYRSYKDGLTGASSSQSRTIDLFWNKFYNKLDSNNISDKKSSNVNLYHNEVIKLIMNRFATLFPFLIRVSPLRWQQVFGAGSAILAAFLALAGAAWSLDLPDVLCFNLFGAIYWLFIYISIYIEIRWGVYERTKEWIKKTWLFRKMKKAFTLERQAIVFILQNGFLITSFGIFILCYKLLFPEIEKGNLVNPLQVIAQLSCFLFNFKYPLKPVRVRHLLLLCFFLSLLSSLHLQGIDWEILSLVLFFFLILIYFFPLDYANLIIFCGYFLDQELAKWGFFLAFQQVGHYALSLFLEKEQSSSTPKKRCLSFILLLIIQLIYGLLYYKDLYLMEPLKLAALLSGACIIFISLSRRTKWAFLIAFLLYFLISLFIGIKSAPSDKTTILGIPDGIFIFVFMHVWVFLGLFFFKDSLPRRKQPLVPLFFSGLFFFLGSFPELAWLEKWIEGIDLLLLILGFLI